MNKFKNTALTESLTRHIGFFYNTEVWRNKIYKKLIEFYPSVMIHKRIKNQLIILKDGSTIGFYNAEKAFKHFYCRNTQIYIENTVSEKDKKIIENLLVRMPVNEKLMCIDDNLEFITNKEWLA